VKAGLLRDIRKGPIAIVPIEPVRGRRGAGEPGAAQNQDIEPTVAIVVEEGRPAADTLQNVRLTIDLSIDDRFAEASRCTDIGELRVERQA